MSDILISVVDDDESVGKATCRLIKSFGYEVEFSSSAEAFLRSAHLGATSCVILDLQMPGMSGLELQTYLATAGYEIPIIFITAYLDDEMRKRALQAGAVDFLAKPVSERALLASIRSATTNNTPASSYKPS